MKRNLIKQAEKPTFRLSPRYAEKLLEQASAANVTPNQFARIATMLVSQNGLLSLVERFESVENKLIRLQNDFNDAVFEDEG